MAGLKVSSLGPQIGENWGFSPLKFLGGTYEQISRKETISGHTASCGKVSRKSTQERQTTG